MENGEVTEFIDEFTYEELYWKYNGETYFTDGVIFDSKKQKYSFFIIVVSDQNGWWVRDVYAFEGDSVSDCVKAFENAPIWNGRTFYEAESEMTWVDSWGADKL